MNEKIVLLGIKDKITEGDFLTLSAILENMPEEKQKRVLQALLYCPLINPITPLIASIIAGFASAGWLALDRFIVKDYFLAFLRVFVSFILCLICFFLGIYLEEEGEIIGSEIFLGFTLFFLIVGVVWWIVDLFLVYKKAKRQNYEKILNIMQL
ncbi:hypothetical protein ACIMK4_001567 [Campylobacter upsaliensis]